MKTIFHQKAFIYLLIGIFIISCQSTSEKQSAEGHSYIGATLDTMATSEEIDNMSIEERAKYERIQDSIRYSSHEYKKRLAQQKEEAEKQEKRIASLKKYFTYKKDEFNNTGWYTHKTFNSSSNYRKTLKAHVDKNGYIYLESQWYDDDWLFHTKVQVKIGDQILSTDVVETYEKTNVQQNEGGEVWETISYIGGKDNGILEAIAKSTGIVKVRFEGREFIKDILLPEKDRLAIKHCYELSQAIKGF